MAKPFVKWAGGKGKLLGRLQANLPENFWAQPAVTYIEPFVGGGAMLFFMLENYPNINRVIINDINPALINCYRWIKNNPQAIIQLLRTYEEEYEALTDNEQKKAYYLVKREEYNLLTRRRSQTAAALFLFLNKTCFNGLYRENRQGKYNVPWGQYVHPGICQEDVIMAAHRALRNVQILCGNYKKAYNKVRYLSTNFKYILLYQEHNPSAARIFSLASPCGSICSKEELAAKSKAYGYEPRRDKEYVIYSLSEPLKGVDGDFRKDPLNLEDPRYNACWFRPLSEIIKCFVI